MEFMELYVSSGTVVKLTENKKAKENKLMGEIKALNEAIDSMDKKDIENSNVYQLITYLKNKEASYE